MTNENPGQIGPPMAKLSHSTAEPPQPEMGSEHESRLSNAEHQVYIGVLMDTGDYTEYPSGGWGYTDHGPDCNHPLELVIHTVETVDYVERVEIPADRIMAIMIRIYHPPMRTESDSEAQS